MQVFPQAEHRWCARHIFSNWSKKYGIGEVKKKFFVCAWSTFEEEFKDNLLKLGELTKKGVEDVLKYPHTPGAEHISAADQRVGWWTATLQSVLIHGFLLQDTSL